MASVRVGSAPGVWGGYLLFFGVIFVMMAWGGSDRQFRWLAEHRMKTVTLDPQQLRPEHEGKLLHITARIDPNTQTHTDPVFGVTTQAFALVRYPSLYEMKSNEQDRPSPPAWCHQKDILLEGDQPEAADPFRRVVWRSTELRAGTYTLDPRLVLNLVQRWSEGSAPDHDGSETLTPDRKVAFLLSTIGYQRPRLLVEAPGIPLPEGWWYSADDSRFGSGQLPPPPTLGDRRVDHHAIVFPSEEFTFLCTASEGVLRPMPQEHGGLFFAIFSGAVDREEAFDRVIQWESRGRTRGLLLGVLLLAVGAGLIVWQVRRERTQMPSDEPAPIAGTAPADSQVLFPPKCRGGYDRL
jgi:hypothetical protein